MTIENKFEVAVRSKLRFPFKGQISVEDLWDLSLENLDSVWKTLNSQQKKSNEESLLETKTAEDKALDLKIEIVEYVFSVKRDENKVKLQEKEKKEMKQKLLEIRNSKQDEELRNKSKEEIDAMISDLDN